MKRQTLCFIALFTITAPLLAQKVGLPAGSHGEVTLDWSQFRDMWKKMQDMEKKIEEFQKPENRPPVPFTLTRAAYKGTVGAKNTVMTALFQIDVYDSRNWVQVPLLPTSVAITAAELNGQPIGIVQDNGCHAVVLKKAGRYILRVQFTVRSPKPEESPQLNFNILSTAITLLELEFPRPHLEVQIEPSQGLDIQTIGNRTRVTAALTPTSTVSVRWQKAVPEEAAGPAKVYVDAQHLMTVSEGALKARWNLDYTILRHGVRELRLLAPTDWNILSVTCEGLQEWKTLSTEKGPVILLQFPYSRKGNLAVDVEMERAASGKDEVVELPKLQPLDVEREAGTIGIQSKGPLELHVQNTEGLQPIDPQELTGDVWSSATQPILFAYRYTKAHTLALDIQRHPETPVLTTTVDEANAVTVMTQRGQLITKIRYQVRNQLKQYLVVKLPQGAALWSAFVAGEPVKPMQSQEGSYRIPLARSQVGAAGQGGFPVELVYYRQTPGMTILGARSMTLPMPDAPVSRLFWSVYLPQKYRFPYFGGDVEKGDAASVWNALAGGASYARRREGASENALNDHAALRKDLQSLEGKIGGSFNSPSPSSVAKQVGLDEEFLKKSELVPTASGVYPVAFELPATGQLFNFGQIMVIGQDPKLTLVSIHIHLLQALLLFLFSAVVYFLYRSRQWLMGLILRYGPRCKGLVHALGIHGPLGVH